MMMSNPAPTADSAFDVNQASQDPLSSLESRLQNLDTHDAADASTGPAFASAAGGKNPLLARIKAAQERAKTSQAPGGSPVDLLDAFDSPDAAAAPAPAMDFMAPAATTTTPDMMNFPTAAATPSFEDLMGNSTPAAPPSSAPNSAVAEAESAMAAILGLEGLSEAEKAELIAEQERILANLQNQKSSRATNLADAFEQRSHAAAVQAIGGRSARPATAARSAHQMSEEEQIAFAIRASQGGVSDDDLAAVQAVQQLQSDEELAQQLQKEEYKKAQERSSRGAARGSRPTSNSVSTPGQTMSSSFMSWLGLDPNASANTGPEIPTSFAQRPLTRGEVGVSRPPGAGNSAALRSAPSYTGEQGSPYSNRSVDMYAPEQQPTVARVAERQDLFSCVAGSISSAATQIYHSVAQDAEGNLHGVDSSGLLGVSQSGQQNYQPMGGHR